MEQQANLRELMKDPSFVVNFHAFAKKNACEESINFWMDYELVKHEYDTSLLPEKERKERVAIKNCELCDKYLRVGCNHELNIDAEMRRDIWEMVEAGRPMRLTSSNILALNNEDDPDKIPTYSYKSQMAFELLQETDYLSPVRDEIYGLIFNDSFSRWLREGRGGAGANGKKKSSSSKSKISQLLHNIFSTSSSSKKKITKDDSILFLRSRSMQAPGARSSNNRNSAHGSRIASSQSFTNEDGFVSSHNASMSCTSTPKRRASVLAPFRRTSSGQVSGSSGSEMPSSGGGATGVGGNISSFMNRTNSEILLDKYIKSLKKDEDN